MNRHPLAALALALGTALTVPVMPAYALAAPAIKSTQTIAGPIQEYTLKNGMKVILKENHAAPVVTWVVTYKVGSRNEATGWTGSTHMLEHMLFKGTKNLGKGQISQLLQRNGADFNATTWTDRTNYFETYSSDKLEMGIRLEADRMRNSLILDSERQSEMTVVRNEMERGESSPVMNLYEAITAQAYQAHPYHHSTIGWRSDVEGVPTARLKEFYNTFYHPNNAVAVLVGDFKSADAIKLIEKYFGAIPAAKHIPPMYTAEEPQEGIRRFTLRKRGETNLVQTGWHIPSVNHKDIAALKVLETLMGSGRTSRLYQALVDKEITTDAWADCGLQRDPSLFRIGMTVRPGVKHEDAEQAMRAELEKLKTTPVELQELQKAKNQAEAGYIFQNNGTEGLAINLGEYEAMAGKWQRAFALLDEVKKVTPADIQRVAKTYLHDDNLTIGYYVATPDGPVRPQPKNAGSGKAVANNAPVKPLPLMDFEKRPVKEQKLTVPVRRVLSNGMTVLVLQNKNNPTVAIDGFVRTGGVHDPEGKEGLASLTASMLEEGTTKRDKLKIAGDLEFVGASVGFSGGTETTGISGSTLSKDLDRTLDVLAEEMMTPAFPESELAKLKANWITSIKQAEEQPATRAGRAFNHAIYQPGHPYYDLDPQQQIKAIESITPEDLRAFHAKHYGPNGVVLAVVGDVSADAVVAKLEQRFAAWPKVAVAAVSIPDGMPAKASKTIIPMMDQTNVAIVYGNPTTVRRMDPDYYAVRIANFVLGGSPLSARLGIKLRDEMGLTYDARSSIRPTFGPGPWTATVTVNPANVPTALDALKRELGKFVTKGVTADELAKAKTAFIGSSAVDLATNSGMAGSLSSIERYGLGLDFWGRYPKLIQGVTLQAVNQAARKIVKPDAAGLAIAGPYQGK
ncbi:MAG TPA: pitrilysin family protein [Pantanalinema sp.]